MRDQKNLLQLVDSEWRDAFILFLETGEDTPGFADFVAHDQSAQLALEMGLVIVEDEIRALLTQVTASVRR